MACVWAQGRLEEAQSQGDEDEVFLKNDSALAPSGETKERQNLSTMKSKWMTRKARRTREGEGVREVGAGQGQDGVSS